jgi:ABC-type multidrug transport system fused ATPase/permease subunit
MVFTSILRQDVVFFDGMSTGQLTNRLADDAMQMLSPLSWALTHLLESSISLVGGLFMCLWVSWKLSILAFTSIYPVIVITQTYAIWSSQLWQVIQVARGDAAAAATEAFQNIRTVRAFSAERLEEANYDTHTRKALKSVVQSIEALQWLKQRFCLTDALCIHSCCWWNGMVGGAFAKRLEVHCRGCSLSTPTWRRASSSSGTVAWSSSQQDL